jgi:hypothetical protein
VDVPPFFNSGVHEGGTIWDGDAMTFGFGVGVHTLRADRSGPPVNSQGSVRPDWDGGIARLWSGNWVNAAPAGEPNALNPLAHGYRALEPLGYGYGILHITEAAIPMVVTDGDVDNRSGSSPVVGQAVQFQGMLSGQTAKFVAALNLYLTATKYQTDLDLSGQTVTVTPKVGAGGYWLQSSGEGYDRDWSNMTCVSVVSYQGAGRTEVSVEGAVVVPRGAAGDLNVLDVVTGQTRRVHLTAGAWTLEFGSRGISVSRLTT